MNLLVLRLVGAGQRGRSLGTELFAKGLEQAARHERQDQVDHERHAVDLHLAVVHAGDGGGSVHEVEHADDRKH